MRCKTCQYALWNLSSRVCPECGTAFAPSQFEFALNSVRFMCPHCSQAYYGTDARGHLVPPEFDCVKCGRHIHMDQMVLLPTEGVAEERTRAEGSPWLERKERGAVAGWFTTVIRSVFQPTRLMRSTPVGSSMGSAVWFAMLTNGVYLSLNLVVMAAWLLLMFSQAGGATGFTGLGFILGLAGWFVGLLVMMGLWTLVAHGLLKLTGDTAGGIERTAQAICYSSAANVLSAVPCLGVYLGPIALVWWAIGATFMTIEGQRVSGWRGTLAVAGPPMVLVTLLVLSVVWMIVGATTAIASAQAVIAQNPVIQAAARPTETQAVLDAVLAYGLYHGGAAPDHAARLVLEGTLRPEQMLAGGSGTTAADASVAGMRLESLPGSGETGEGAVAGAAAGLGAGVVAYRVGDFVFTCPGINLATGDPGLWIVVCAPDPYRAGAVRVPGATVPVGRLGGTVTLIAGTAFSAALEEQNALRAQYGLAALPDPSLVKEGSPAVGGR